MICLTPKPIQSFFLYRIESKKKFLQKKRFFKEKGDWRIEQKRKKSFNSSHNGD